MQRPKMPGGGDLTGGRLAKKTDQGTSGQAPHTAARHSSAAGNNPSTTTNGGPGGRARAADHLTNEGTRRRAARARGGRPGRRRRARPGPEQGGANHAGKKGLRQNAPPCGVANKGRVPQRGCGASGPVGGEERAPGACGGDPDEPPAEGKAPQPGGTS